MNFARLSLVGILAILMVTAFVLIFDLAVVQAYSQLEQRPVLTSQNQSDDDADNVASDTDRVPLIIEHVITSNTTERFLGPNMAFLGPNDMLVLEDIKGKVWRITNGQISEEPLLDLPVSTPDGLTGLAVSKHDNGSTYVFLYLNESPIKSGKDVSTIEEQENLNQTLGYDREGDRLYRYELINNRLVNPKLLLQIADKSTNVVHENHHGGEVLVGPDNNVYVTIGDIDGFYHPDSKTKAQNYQNGTEPDGRAGIIHITQDGNVINGDGILGDEDPLNKYYAYGIRNSFGIDFDPITGNLWDTENGPNYGDEINLVEPGFNGGWSKVQGFWKPDVEDRGEEDLDPDDLVDFGGEGEYSPPKFVWNATVAPTALKFFNSDKFGEEYENDMFVSDVNNGNLYHFDLNDDRTELELDNPLDDKIADNKEELQPIIFAKGFNGIVDLQVGPDGYLYVLSNGSIFRIRPATN